MEKCWGMLGVSSITATLRRGPCSALPSGDILTRCVTGDFAKLPVMALCQEQIPSEAPREASKLS